MTDRFPIRLTRIGALPVRTHTRQPCRRGVAHIPNHAAQMPADIPGPPHHCHCMQQEPARAMPAQPEAERIPTPYRHWFRGDWVHRNLLASMKHDGPAVIKIDSRKLPAHDRHAATVAPARQSDDRSCQFFTTASKPLKVLAHPEKNGELCSPSRRSV